MAMSEAALDARIRNALTRPHGAGVRYPDIVRDLEDVDRPRLEARLHYLQSTGQVQQLCGLWSAVTTDRSPPPEPDHRRIPPSCFIAHQPTSEMAHGTDLHVRRNRITERPAEEPEPVATPTPAAPVIEDPPMAKMKTCRTCGTKKTLEEFDPANRSPDKHTSDCHQCRQDAAAPAPKTLATVAAKHARVNGSHGFQSAIDALRADRDATQARLANLEQAIEVLERLQ